LDIDEIKIKKLNREMMKLFILRIGMEIKEVKKVNAEQQFE